MSRMPSAPPRNGAPASDNQKSWFLKAGIVIARPINSSTSATHGRSGMKRVSSFRIVSGIIERL